MIMLILRDKNSVLILCIPKVAVFFWPRNIRIINVYAMCHINVQYAYRFADQSTSTLGQRKWVFDWYGFVLDALQQLQIGECFNDIYKRKKEYSKSVSGLCRLFTCGSATRATIVRRTCCSVTEKSYAKEHCSEEH